VKFCWSHVIIAMSWTPLAYWLLCFICSFSAMVAEKVLFLGDTVKKQLWSANIVMNADHTWHDYERAIQSVKSHVNCYSSILPGSRLTCCSNPAHSTGKKYSSFGNCPRTQSFLHYSPFSKLGTSKPSHPGTRRMLYASNAAAKVSWWVEVEMKRT
jgi:hypothetical protein